MKLNEHLVVSPDLQLVQRAGGHALIVKLVGLRASLGF